MAKILAYLFIFILVTSTSIQVAQTYFGDATTLIAQTGQEEDEKTEPQEPMLFALAFQDNEYCYASLQQAKFSLYEHFPVGEDHSSGIDFPPEAIA